MITFVVESNHYMYGHGWYGQMLLHLCLSSHSWFIFIAFLVIYSCYYIYGWYKYTNAKFTGSCQLKVSRSHACVKERVRQIRGKDRRWKGLPPGAKCSKTHYIPCYIFKEWMAIPFDGQYRQTATLYWTSLYCLYWYWLEISSFKSLVNVTIMEIYNVYIYIYI